MSNAGYASVVVKWSYFLRHRYCLKGLRSGRARLSVAHARPHTTVHTKDRGAVKPHEIDPQLAVLELRARYLQDSDSAWQDDVALVVAHLHHEFVARLKE